MRVLATGVPQAGHITPSSRWPRCPTRRETRWPEQEELLDAYLPIVVAHECERRAALTPRERAAEPKAWLAASASTVRGRG